MPLNIGLYSYSAAALAYGVVSLLLVIAWRGRPFHLSVLVACGATAIWAAITAVSTVLEYPAIVSMQLAEIVRDAAWAFLLLKYISAQLEGQDHRFANLNWKAWYAGGLLVVLAMLFGLPRALAFSETLPRDVIFITWLALATAALLLLEQLFRNATIDERWSSKYLCLGLGFLFAYDFFMYAEALLFRQLNPILWQARGFAAALSAPMIAISIARNTQWNLGIHVSRHVVFHSFTLLAAGVYLLLMASAGYFIRFLGGSWGGVLQVSFLFAAGLLLFSLLFSGKIRAQTRVWLSKHFFSYKYDYREEWLQFTGKLGDAGDNVPDSVVQSVAALASSPSGLLWTRTDDETFELISHWQMPEPKTPVDFAGLPDWLERTQWIIDLAEWYREPDLYDDLTMPESVLAIERAWLIVPLMLDTKLQGILLLRVSDLKDELNWEDRDLLKVAGRQAASYLAQYLSSQALMESRQFEAFNRLSAYVVHDLKNILAQQSLIVKNAEKHKHKPEFVDDVIATVDNSVKRMTALMEQMRSGIRGNTPLAVDLCEILPDVVERRSVQLPAPQLQMDCAEAVIEADKEQLATVFNHIIQNAQEATSKTGTVRVRLLRSNGSAVVEIEDDGEGMDETFIRTRLFRPFDSTKGLTGMGIGAFESRETIRTLGGDIQVTSVPGQGSLFLITLPLSMNQSDTTDSDTREKQQ
tara:strand:+ start:7775 stop:9865 length:2091 start_codon:yes stop_codon:yes gene_type:complete